MSDSDPEQRSNWTMVVAVANNRVIGREDGLPWRLSSDLKRFKALTTGNCLVMGRKTYDSIGRPLPDRQTIVLSRCGYSTGNADVLVINDLADLDARVHPGRKVMIVGGAQVYAAALPHCQTIWLTRVLADVEGDTYFPVIDWSNWQLETTESLDAGPKDQWATEFQIWKRKPTP